MGWRNRAWTKLRAARVRARTISCGVALGGVLLLALALVGGVDQLPTHPEPAAPGHLGPLTAVQPELRRALLTGSDLPTPQPSKVPTATTAPPPVRQPPTAPATEGVGLTGLCELLLNDPTGLPGLWQAIPPEESTAHHTRRPGGAVLDQVLSVFEAGRAPEAYRQLREAATGCDRFPTTLADGTPVTVLLRELALDRRESAAADQAYAVTITVEGRDPGEGGGEDAGLVGWLALDRVGPVVSVLRHRGPVDPGAADPAEIREVALEKLRPLLRLLRR